MHDWVDEGISLAFKDVDLCHEMTHIALHETSRGFR